MSWFRKRTQKAVPPRKREVPLIKLEELHKAEDKESREEIKETEYAVNIVRAKAETSTDL